MIAPAPKSSGIIAKARKQAKEAKRAEHLFRERAARNLPMTIHVASPTDAALSRAAALRSVTRNALVSSIVERITLAGCIDDIVGPPIRRRL